MSQYNINIVMLGQGSVGKSAITLQLISSKFVMTYSPTIEESFKTTLMVDDKMIAVTVTDTSGQEEYNALSEYYMRKGDGFVVVYSIVIESTFDKVDDIHKQLQAVFENDPDHVPIILVGNKCDLGNERTVPTAKGKALADSWNALFIESSAKDNINIKEL
ncbi:hypothetical protein EIN_495190, partial [Entamoeba invadens IP1]